jgi:hypothetical protein
MRSQLILVLAGVFCTVVPSVRGDNYFVTMFPASQGEAYFYPERNLHIQLCFENLDDYPEYDFYLKYGRSQRDPLRKLYLTRVTSGEFVRLEGEGLQLTPVYLLAVPQGKQPAQPGKHCWKGHHRHAEGWLQFPKLAGALQSAPLTGPDPGNPHVIGVEGSRVVYRVAIDGDQLEATRVYVELQGKDPLLRLVVIAVGVGVSLGLASLLLWRLVRFQIRSTTVPTP